jgi:O-antigen/teichoic acid export membrane protein
MDSGFSWYGEHCADAFPPKSLFVVLLILTALCIPALYMLLPEDAPAAPLIALAVAALSVCLITDVLSTFRRYKLWANQRICGNCRRSYPLQLLSASAPTPG